MSTLGALAGGVGMVLLVIGLPVAFIVVVCPVLLPIVAYVLAPVWAALDMLAHAVHSFVTAFPFWGCANRPC